MEIEVAVNDKRDMLKVNKCNGDIPPMIVHFPPENGMPTIKVPFAFSGVTIPLGRVEEIAIVLMNCYHLAGKYQDKKLREGINTVNPILPG